MTLCKYLFVYISVNMCIFMCIFNCTFTILTGLWYPICFLHRQWSSRLYTIMHLLTTICHTFWDSCSIPVQCPPWLLREDTHWQLIKRLSFWLLSKGSGFIESFEWQSLQQLRVAISATPSHWFKFELLRYHALKKVLPYVITILNLPKSERHQSSTIWSMEWEWNSDPVLINQVDGLRTTV